MSGEKYNKTVMTILFSAGIILMIGVAVLNFIDSPKFYTPKFKENAIEEELNEMQNSESVSENPEFEGTAFPIAINTASSDLLQLIPNIGPATAQLIIDYRNEAGTILDFDELISVAGIGEKTIEILKEYCIIN